MNTDENLNFRPNPINAVGIREGEGAGIQLSKAMIPRIAALRAYNSFGNGRDWMDKLSTAYVVALATRSADALLMKDIQNRIFENSSIACCGCREATLGVNVIRERMFPRLKKLREHANKMVHHFDNPENIGVDTLNVQGVFDYCHHLFQENVEALFGAVPDTTFEFTLCKQCRKNQTK
ncbi:MAG: hypothetical protein V4805_12100 [Pseudomonadota bacterium]